MTIDGTDHSYTGDSEFRGEAVQEASYFGSLGNGT